MSVDPLRTCWDALDRGGYGPHGPLHSIRSRCPLCGSANPAALHVFVGADGRAVPHCFVCQGHPKDIAQAAGLDPRDSFPPGHRSARRRHLREARRTDFTGPAREIVNAIKALDGLGASWDIELRTDCAHCGSPRALIFASSRGRVFLSCPNDSYAQELGYIPCSLDEFQQALAGRIEDHQREAA